ncbi:MAG: hypothetical protein JXA37_08650 [Chloroflexia bacterium]|nr:hypothetical protein [Chloroflexia bacterium]
MDMIPIDIPAPLHQDLVRLANERGRVLEELVRGFLADGLCREQNALQQQGLLQECYRVMAQDSQMEGESFLSLQDEAMG